MTRALLWAAAIATLALFVFGAINPAAWEYSEGDAATWIWMLRHARDIYAAPGLPMWSSNYPPLYLHLVARLAPRDAGILLVGRLISIAGYLLAALMVGLSARAATSSSRAGWMAGTLFAVTARASYQAAACRGDALALGLMLLALHLCAVRARGWVWAVALLCPTALLCKHSLVVVPIAIGLWSLVREPRKAIVLLGSAAIFLFAIWKLNWMAPLFGWSQSSWSFRLWLSSIGWWLAPSAIGLILAAIAWRRASSPVLGPWIAVLAVAALWTLSLGRVGASFNYLLELLAAISVLSVTMMSSRLFAAHVAVTSIEAIAWCVYLVGILLPQAQRELKNAQAILRDDQDPVFVEETWHATSLGRPPIAIPFLSSHLAESGRWDQKPLVSLIESGAFAHVLLDFSLDNPGWHSDRFTREELAALRARYVLFDQKEELRVYRPR